VDCSAGRASLVGTPLSKLDLLGDYLAFLRQQRKWWLVPIVVALFAIGGLVVFTEGSALAPFIYSLF